MAEYPSINMKQGIINFGGDEGLYTNLMDEFDKNSLTQLMKEVHQNVLSLAFDPIAKSAHKIKSGFGYIGAERAQQLCVELEDSAIMAHKESQARGKADQKSINQIVSKYLNLIQETKMVKRDMSRILQKHPDMRELELLENQARNRFTSNIEIGEHDATVKQQACCAGCNIF